MSELEKLITDRTRLIIINSPHNPTGGVLNKRDIEQIAQAIGDRNIFVLSDEIYSRLIFDGSHHSIISEPGFKERTILLDGFSKTYAMTGWRMGYGVMRPDLATQVARLDDQLEFLHRKLFSGSGNRSAARAIRAQSITCAKNFSGGGACLSPD